MRTFGLIGFPLSHSFSATYFAEKFRNETITDAKYLNFPLEDISLFSQLLENQKDLTGLNVTIPYKTQVIPFLTHLSDSIKVIGAVNTIKIKKDPDKLELWGFNTDEYGFRQSLLPHLRDIHDKALILGTGGASKAVEFVLSSLNIPYFLVSRKPQGKNELSYDQLTSEIIYSHKLIINTTPLGMYPKIDEFPDIPYNYITSEHILFDLIYNPSITKFLNQGLLKGATTLNGLEMLQLQAEKAWEIWNNPSM